MSIWKKVSGYKDSSPRLAPIKKSKSKTNEGDPSKGSDCPKDIEANLSESKYVDSKDRESQADSTPKIDNRQGKTQNSKTIDKSANNLTILGKKKIGGFSLAQIVARRLGFGGSSPKPNP
jgi:ABC-type multidrug transport system fused ATPase/permease subunit